MRGRAAQAGTCAIRAYTIPATHSATQPSASVARKPPSGVCICAILAFTACLAAQEPPPDLVRRVAERETEDRAARDQYTYRQTVIVEEMDSRGIRLGSYREMRDIIFLPNSERSERMIEQPSSSLKHLLLTEEDFRDIREVQPFVLTSDQLRLYDTRFRGEETMDDVECWVLQVRPRQILDRQRLFDGLLWVGKNGFHVVRAEGRAVPEIRRAKQENLFPRFTTIRTQVDSKHWFPVRTFADDTLQFRTGPQRIRLSILYNNYKRFSADATVRYEK